VAIVNRVRRPPRNIEPVWRARTKACDRADAGERSLDLTTVADDLTTIAVDHPPLAGCDLVEPTLELVRIDRHPAREVVDRVELDERHTEPSGQ
jgi:hypothetical protein